MNEVFLDTSFAIALAAKGDRHFEQARRLSLELRRQRVRMTTTRAVTLEIGNALSRLRHRQTAVQLLAALAADPLVEVVPLSEALYEKGWTLYQQRSDKEWSLVDCISFALMDERRLREALTADEHFEQAGFRALLRSS
jgi:predicted nucleic acid-binding protein